MRALNYLFVPIAILFGFTSCVINGSGYDLLSKEDRMKVKTCVDPIDSLNADGNIYMITAQQLKDCLVGRDWAVVYDWAPWCSAEACVLPSDAEDICKDAGYDFFFVSETYDETGRAAGVKSPVLVINREYYNTDNYKRYRRLFLEELTGKSIKSLGYGRFLVFRHGEYVRSCENVTETLVK